MMITTREKIRQEIVGATLVCILLMLPGCAVHEARAPHQDGVQEARPSERIDAEKRKAPPGPPPFAEKLAPVTRNLTDDKRLYSMVFESAPLAEVIRALSADHPLNLIADSEIDLDRPVTLNLKNVTFTEALDMAVVKGAGYAWSIEENNLYIQRFQERVYQLDYLDLSGETEIEVGGDMLASGIEDAGVSGKYALKTKRESKVTDVWTSIRSALEGLKSADGLLQLNRSSGIIYMVDTPRNIERMVRFLDSMAESLHRQVFIEAKILEVKLNDSAKYGIDWSGLDVRFRAGTNRLPDELSLNLNSGTIAKSGGAVLMTLPSVEETDLEGRLTRYDQPGISRFNAVLDFLRTQGDISVLSNPHLTVMNGQSALMTVGYQFPYGDVEGVDRDPETGVVTIGTQIRRAVLGLQLGITPQISKDGIITLNIVPTITRIQGEENVELPTTTTAVQNIANPVIDLQGLATTVRVKEGQSVVLAGLIRQIKNANQEGLPILGDLPYIGKLFKHIEETKESQELVIFITPHLKRVM